MTATPDEPKQGSGAISGSHPSDQAASHLGASRVNPGRMANGPELWSAILERMPRGAIVAGGAVRDYLLGFEPKDIDVFMGEPPKADESEPFEFSGEIYDPRHGLFRIEDSHERFEEYAAVSCILCVSSGQLLGYKVDAVEIEHYQGGAELIDEFDFGITRCWFDGEIHDTEEARRDRESKRFTLLRDERVKRSIARFERLKARWGDDWSLDASAIEARRAIDVEGGVVASDESAVPKADAQQVQP